MTTLTDSIRLVAVATAASRARRFTANTLTLWGAHDSLVDDACVITSELVTNAICATGTLELEPSPETLADLPLIGLGLTLARERLIIRITDVSDTPPTMRQQYEAAEDGRGLFLVTMLAEEWSYYSVATGGKVVWAELAVPRGVRRTETLGRQQAARQLC